MFKQRNVYLANAEWCFHMVKQQQKWKSPATLVQYYETHSWYFLFSWAEECLNSDPIYYQQME